MCKLPVCPVSATPPPGHNGKCQTVQSNVPVQTTKMSLSVLSCPCPWNLFCLLAHLSTTVSHKRRKRERDERDQEKRERGKGDRETLDRLRQEMRADRRRRHGTSQPHACLTLFHAMQVLQLLFQMHSLPVNAWSRYAAHAICRGHKCYMTCKCQSVLLQLLPAVVKGHCQAKASFETAQCLNPNCPKLIK